ncbi:hypothetical protein HYH03_001233 [Edaphochlamys debaryana]|uniref:Uncharacterized protein n=1 Tax=Edaphochlamys debaryana TaxID=47281 RepID=A0A835YEK6_9CHLO|nr:hypothetical protein HYH03_001233 [Edaphochlamys debaryana]|eukprot:KAG2501452.1 hypothetical protein HYH03_001233 [Edaphochlamys debaryana]
MNPLYAGHGVPLMPGPLALYMAGTNDMYIPYYSKAVAKVFERLRASEGADSPVVGDLAEFFENGYVEHATDKYRYALKVVTLSKAAKEADMFAAFQFTSARATYFRFCDVRPAKTLPEDAYFAVSNPPDVEHLIKAGIDPPLPSAVDEARRTVEACELELLPPLKPRGIKELDEIKMTWLGKDEAKKAKLRATLPALGVVNEFFKHTFTVFCPHTNLWGLVHTANVPGSKQPPILWSSTTQEALPFKICKDSGLSGVVLVRPFSRAASRVFIHDLWEVSDAYTFYHHLGFTQPPPVKPPANTAPAGAPARMPAPAPGPAASAAAAAAAAAPAGAPALMPVPEPAGAAAAAAAAVPGPLEGEPMDVEMVPQTEDPESASDADEAGKVGEGAGACEGLEAGEACEVDKAGTGGEDGQGGMDGAGSEDGEGGEGGAGGGSTVEGAGREGGSVAGVSEDGEGDEVASDAGETSADVPTGGPIAYAGEAGNTLRPAASNLTTSSTTAHTFSVGSGMAALSMYDSDDE